MNITNFIKKLFWIISVSACILLAVVIITLAVKPRDPYADSAAHEVLALIKEKQYTEAKNVYETKVRQEENGEKIMEALLKEYIVELDVQYRNEIIDLDAYTFRCKEIFDICRTDALTTQTKDQLQAILNEHYDRYMQIRETDDGSGYYEAKRAFEDVLEMDLGIVFEDSKKKFAQMMKIKDAIEFYRKGLSYEQAYNYTKAWECYTKISADTPYYEDAQAAIASSAESFCKKEIAYAEQNGTVWGYESAQSAIQRAKSVLYGNEFLLNTEQEILQTLKTLSRKEAEDTMADPKATYWSKWGTVNKALSYNEGDTELQTLRTNLTEPMKQEFYKMLRSRMGDQVYSYRDLVDSLYDRLPEDPDVQKLNAAAIRYGEYHLDRAMNNAKNIKFLYYPRRLTTTGPNGEVQFANDPIADIHGVKHDPFNLYRVTASVNNPAMFRSKEWSRGAGLKQLSFTVDAAVGCGSGSAVIEVYTCDGENRTKIYTSPALNRKTKNLKVDVDLSSVAEIEVRVVAQSGSVTLLWDHAYVDRINTFG